DNADQRLTPRGLAIGCIGSDRARMFHVKQSALAGARELAGRFSASPSALARQGVSINQDGVMRSALDLLAYPDIDWDRLAGLWPELTAVPPRLADQLTIARR